MFKLKPRPETLAVMDKLDTYDYACLWLNGIPKITFKKGDGLWTVDRYITKFIPEKQEYFVDGAYEEDLREDVIHV